MMVTIGLIAAGGAIGAVARYGVSVGVGSLAGQGFPWATLCVNVIGAFLMGVLVAKIEAGAFAAQWIRPFLMTGLLGAFTTFSTFSLEAVQLYERGEAIQAVLYILLSVVLSCLGLVLGFILIRGGIA